MDNSQVVFGRLNDYITHTMWEDQIPGAIVALTDRERTAFISAFGYSDMASGAPVKLDTLFRIGGLSKSFTAVALLQLVEAGRVDLHKPVTHYLPWLKLESPDKTPVTLHHLLSHTAGITSGCEAYPAPRAEMLALAESRLCAPPGTAFHYSNLGYKILGILLEDILGQPYGDIIQARILDPLGMERSRPAVTYAIRDRLAQGYDPYYDDRPRAPTDVVSAAPWLESDSGAGSLAATASDMTVYLRMLLNRGQAGVLSPASFNLMTRPVVQTDQPDMFYGYGLMIGQIDKHLYIRHSGSIAGYSAEMLADVDNGIGVVILGNKRGGSFFKAAEYAIRTMRAARKRHDLPSAPPYSETYLIPNAADYAGSYTCGSKTLRLIAEDNGLLLIHRDEYIFLEARGRDAFYVNFEGFRLFLLEFGRKSQSGPAIDVFYGADRYIRDGYEDDAPFEYPPEWDAYPGHYRANDPWLSNFRVVIQRDQLRLIYPTDGHSIALIPVENGVFSVGKSSCPERIAFDQIVNGNAQRARLGLGNYYRFFTP